MAAPILALAHPGSAEVAVLGRPGDGAAASVRAVAAAGGSLVGAGRFSGMVIARSDEPGFARRLYAAGAWLVVRAALAGGCAPAPAASLSPQLRDDTALTR